VQHTVHSPAQVGEQGFFRVKVSSFAEASEDKEE
jgi:hypothetical protein